MAYTWNTDRTGGVGITSKITQKGIDEFPLMYANDLDWADVEIESGVTLKKTDDLLDYIKGANNSIIGRIDEVELANAGYEVRCEKSVCYVGEVLNNIPFYIYKNGTLLTWANITAEGITLKSPITKPTGANDLIQFTSNGLKLNGTANKAGAYVFEFVKGAGTASEVCIASFMLTVLIKPLGSYQTTIYISSQSKPETPTGGSYNFDSKVFTAPTGWSTSITGLSTPIWFSTGTVFSDNADTPSWSEPCMYFDHDMVDIEHHTRNVAVYLTTSSNVLQAGTPYGGTYDWTNDTWTTPKTSQNSNQYWSKTPAASIEAYLQGLGNAVNADDYEGGKYITWVSYKYYRSQLTNGTRGNLTEGEWSTPVKYVDIDAILEDAKTRSQKIVSDAIEEAYSDLEEAASLINEGGVVVDAVRSLYEWKVLDSATASVITSSDTDLYAPFAARFLSSSQLVGTITQMNTPISGSTNDILTSAYFDKCILFDSITDSDGTHTNAYVGYVNTTKELRTQMAALDTQVGTLTTSVNSMTPDKIRLQVSEALQKEYAYVPITSTEYSAQETNNPTKCHKYLYDNSGNLTSTEITTLATTAYNAQTNNYNGYQIGHYYKLKISAGVYEYYRCDYPLSTGFMSLLANRATLGVASNTADNGLEKGAFISFGFDEYGDGETIIGGDTVKITGNTIAGAIAAQDLNIKNKSYLKGNGDAIFGASTAGESRFLADGTGYIADGTIRWSNGKTYIDDLYIGHPMMGWHINGGAMGPNDEYVDLMPFIWSQYHDTTNNKYINLAIRPDVIECYSKATNDSGFGGGTRTVNWSIDQSGNALFASGNATFNADGSAVIGNQTTNITMSSSGTISLTGIGVSISAADQAQIGTTVKNNITGDSTFIGTVANAAGVTVKGNLNTDDISVGNGACFFKGTDNSTAEIHHGVSYAAHQLGAGHLAKGNIWWDADGNLSIGGQLRLKGTSLEWGGAVQQYELTPTDFSTTYGISSKQGTFRSKGAIYSLPDPAEYLGREIFVEVYVTGQSISTILNDSSYLSSGSAILKMPCFEIDSDNWKHKWIKWGVDACKYTTSDINHLPKFYLLGSPFMYNGNDGRDENEESGLAQYHTITVDNTQNSRANMANDFFWEFSQMTSGVLSAGLSDSGSNRYGRKGGLYLVPNAHKCQQMFDCTTDSSHDNDQIILRMRCLAKKIRNSGDGNNAWYYWEIQTTDFIPFFDNMPFDPNSGSTISSDYVDGNRNYDLTASSFYDVYEKAFASSLLAFDDNFDVVTMNSDNINNGGLLTNMN